MSEEQNNNSENVETDLKRMLGYWKEVKKPLEEFTYENMTIERNIKDLIPILDEYYFSPFILELLSHEQKKHIYNILLEIKSYFINKKNDYLYNQQAQEVNDLIDKLKDYFNSIGGNIPNLAIIMHHQNAFNAQQNSFKQRANELFGELTTNSISHPFNEQNKLFSRRIKRNIFLFYVLLFILFLLFSSLSTLYLLQNEIIKELGIQENTIINTIITSIKNLDILSYSILKLSITIPIVWAILFINKQINQDKKLEQAYLHKYVIAQSYLNYLEFIKKDNYFIARDNNSYQEAMNTLHKVAMESLGLNPALLLDKSTAEKIPMEELLSKFIDRTADNKNSKS